MTAEARLTELGLVLPEPPIPVANYLPFKRDGDLLYLSGQGPRKSDGSYHIGKVGEVFGIDDAYAHARLTGLNLLAVAKLAAGSLDRIEVVKVLGLVNAVPNFGQHPAVINGCSDLFADILGERGRHARSAIGVGSLPHNMSVEIEAIIRLRG